MCFLFKNFNINFMLYLIYTRQYYIIFLHFTLTTICLHFNLATTCAYAFHFNVMYMCLYVHVFLFKNVTSISCYIYFVQDYIT